MTYITHLHGRNCSDGSVMLLDPLTLITVYNVFEIYLLFLILVRGDKYDVAILTSHVRLQYHCSIFAAYLQSVLHVHWTDLQCIRDTI